MVEIRTERLPNTSLERYLYTSLSGRVLITILYVTLRQKGLYNIP
jgi:hypothetical protein